MKILHIATDWKWAKIFILPIANKQIESGQEVWLSTPNSILHEQIDSHINICQWNKKYHQPLRYLLSAIALCNHVKNNNIDIVYTHTSIDSFIYIIFLRVFSNVRIKYVNHGVPYDGYNNIYRFILQFIEMSNVMFAHNIVTITNSMVQLLDRVNLLKKNINCLTPGSLVGVKKVYNTYAELLEERMLYKKINNEDKLTIIFVGRLEKRKGLFELIEAVNHTQLECRLLILGDGKIDMLKNEYSNSKISFLGYEKELSKFYLKADILCVPSYHEGFGQVYLEAMSYGVIPICSNILGPTDFIKHTVNGFCVDAMSSESIINIFNDISKGEYDLVSIQKNAYKTSLVFDSNTVIFNNLKVL